MTYNISPADVNQTLILKKEIRNSGWATELEKVNQAAMNILQKSGLNIHGPLYGFLKDKVKLDFGFVFATEDFLFAHLSEEEQALFAKLYHATDKAITTDIFSEEEQAGFAFDFNYDVLEQDLALQCLYEHSPDEEVRLSYKLPYLFLGEESDHYVPVEGLDDLEDDFDALAIHHLTILEKKLSVPIQALFTQCNELFSSFNKAIAPSLPVIHKEQEETSSSRSHNKN